MKLRIVILAVVVMACGGSGGDGYTTGTGNGPGTGTPPTGGGSAATSATVAMSRGDDGYGTATFSFSPASVTVARGGTITWSNDGSATHNVTFANVTGAPASIANLASGSASRTFNTAGTYSYQCTNHSGMSGSVTVQ